MEKGGGREQEGAKEGDHDHHDDEDDKGTFIKDVITRGGGGE